MQETEIDVNSLYATLLRETENDTIQEVSPDLYTSISNFVSKLKSEGYDGIESKVKDTLLLIITDIVSLLLKIRLEKALNATHTNLMNEEKFILDAQTEMEERKEMILSGLLNGKSKFLESISQKHKTKPIVVRFLKEIDQIVGADLEKYGPFKAEDIATIPYENAQALITKNVVAKIHWED
ncbi:MAG: DNA replication complex subunit Gins51 [Nitrososphaerota archaeon]